MIFDILINRAFYMQVCSNADTKSVLNHVNSNEVSTAKWTLASKQLMDNYGGGDSNIVQCKEYSDRKHYLIVVEGFFA